MGSLKKEKLRRNYYQLFLVSFHISNSFKRQQCFKKVALFTSQIYYSFIIYTGHNVSQFEEHVWDLKNVLCVESASQCSVIYHSQRLSSTPTYRCTVNEITFIEFFGGALI